ncbi:MAG: DUF4124 domain-containing protein [Desulfobacterales bacterium]
MRLIFFGIILVSMMFAVHGYAQIYRYVDQEGNIRFTDNPGNIPKEQREVAKTIKEIKSSPEESRIDEETSWDDVNPQKQMLVNHKTHGKEDNDAQIQVVRESLLLEKEELQGLYEKLEEDKSKLGESLTESASRMEQRIHHQQVLDLNQRIEDYQERVEAYRIKLEAYNQREWGGEH